MNKETGGPAFPVTEDNYVHKDNTGITIRDYFAAKAMQGFIMDEQIHKDAGSGSEWLKGIAKAAYETADAMMEARK
jgi:hypothetical protein